MFETKKSRSIAGAAFILAATAAIAAAGRLLVPPYSPAAPEYRQKGPSDAPVTIVAFSDFQCPACQSVVGPIEQIKTMFPGKIRVVFRHMPWDFHEWALKTAAASECAGRSGKFWEFHDALYARQSSWSSSKTALELSEKITGYAKELGLDPKALNSCAEDPALAESIKQERKEAEKQWIRSTPTLLINGKRFVGSQQLRTLGLNHIENELKRLGS